MHTPNRKIVPFDKVNIGDEVFNHEDEKLVGIIKWKGNTLQLLESEHLDLFQYTVVDGEPETVEEVAENLKDYDWVIVDDPTHGETIYNYNCDPSGVIIMEEQPSLEEDPGLKSIIEKFMNTPTLGHYHQNLQLEYGIPKETYRDIFKIFVSNDVILDDTDHVDLKEKEIINILVAIFIDETQAQMYFGGIELLNGIESAYIINKDNTVINKKVNHLKIIKKVYYD